MPTLATRSVILRDDDTSFFTRPEQLEAIYGPLWARGLPVALAVIPCQRADTRVRHRPGAPSDPSIPPGYRGQPEGFSLAENPALCAYLNEKARAGLVEICLHGYAHSYLEFAAEDSALLSAKLDAGLQLLTAALPDAPIRTFIAPYDRMSAAAVSLVLTRGLNLCTSVTNLAHLSQFASLNTYDAMPAVSGGASDGSTRVFTCDEYIFNHRDAPDACLRTALDRLAGAAVFICANHYWCFHYDWTSPNQPLLDAWYRFLDALLIRPDLSFGTFSTP